MILVDLQKDFCPGGALAVPRGDEVMPVLQRCVEFFQARSAPIVATRDWHPPGHCSFNTRGGPWPPHCVQQTEGAEFHPSIRFPARTTIVSKGTDPSVEAYSGFQGTDLAARLRALRVDTLYVGGLATDYCVKATVLDGLRERFRVVVVIDGCRAVGSHPGDEARAIDEMARAGAMIMTSDALPQRWRDGGKGGGGMVERRKYQRISIKSVAEVSLAPAKERRFAFVGGVSRGGLEIFCQQPLPVGNAVRVQLTFLSRQGQQLQETLDGTIRWCFKLGEAHIAGLEFLAPVEERDHPALWAYLLLKGWASRPAVGPAPPPAPERAAPR